MKEGIECLRFFAGLASCSPALSTPSEHSA
jgi:hypothetical protein